MLIIIFICLFAFAKSEFVFNRFEPTCDLQLFKNITVSSKDWEASYKEVKIKFNLCGILNDQNKNKYVAYIDFRNGTFTGFDKISGILEDKLGFQAVGTSCKLSVKFSCSTYTKPEVQLYNACDYEVSIFSPSTDCSRPYGMMFQNVLLDFRSLQRVYNVCHKGNCTKPCISFCNDMEHCNSDKHDCNIGGNKTAKVITAAFDNIIYKDKENQFELHTHYNENSKKIKIKVQIKCKWFKNSNKLNLLYLGKKINTYEIESSLGCFKQPPVCYITHKLFVYDLSDLYRKNSNWEVKKVNGSRTIYLNVCGPLLLTQDNCSKSHSQICELNNGNYISRGRISWPLVPEITLQDSLVMTFIHGDIGTTKIEFRCSSVDGQPTFISDNDGELLIGWNTTKACAKYVSFYLDLKDNKLVVLPTSFKNPNFCPGKLPSANIAICEYRSTHPNYYNLYNLTDLYNPKGYTVENTRNNNYVYRINVCGPINITEAPCKENVMVAKIFSKELDARKMVISYGSQTDMSLQNESLIVATSSGDSYTHNDNMLDYYSARIQFECDKNITSKIVLQTEGDMVEFLWKTKYACPTTIEISKSCIFNIDKYQKLDLTHSTKKSLFVQYGAKGYLFDLCGYDENMCNPENCTYTKAVKDVKNYHNKPHLEFILNNACKNEHEYNRSLLELICDTLTDNDHFDDKMYIENCTLTIQLHTAKVCTEENVFLPLDNSAENKNVHVNYEVEPDDSNKPLPVVVDKISCLLKNPHTDFVFNISQLKLNVTSPTCPEKSFNFDNKTVTLHYSIPKSCHHSKDNLELIVELNCKDVVQENVTQFRCSRKMSFFLPQACKLLERNSVSGGLIAAYTILSLFSIVLVIGSLYWLYRRQSSCHLYESISLPYRKVPMTPLSVSPAPRL